MTGSGYIFAVAFSESDHQELKKIVVEWLLKHDDVSELWALDQIDREATFINLVAVMNELCALTGLKGFHQAANFMNRPPPSRARTSSLCRTPFITHIVPAMGPKRPQRRNYFFHPGAFQLPPVGVGVCMISGVHV